uniref:uncharacterized protein LOC101372660 n=1 Tax=Odobenus rosmarus divergens TaxID=9708 RepID=UPI00063C56A5|nr:PREDICTED: uncharacterized protein LOC101372660 [Odobenus rosmarus divergens]
MWQQPLVHSNCRTPLDRNCRLHALAVQGRLVLEAPVLEATPLSMPRNLYGLYMHVLPHLKQEGPGNHTGEDRRSVSGNRIQLLPLSCTCLPRAFPELVSSDPAGALLSRLVKQQGPKRPDQTNRSPFPSGISNHPSYLDGAESVCQPAQFIIKGIEAIGAGPLQGRSLMFKVGDSQSQETSQTSKLCSDAEGPVNRKQTFTDKRTDQMSSRLVGCATADIRDGMWKMQSGYVTEGALERRQRMQRDQSKDTENLPGPVSPHLFCNADRGGVNSNLSQLQQSHCFPRGASPDDELIDIFSKGWKEAQTGVRTHVAEWNTGWNCEKLRTTWKSKSPRKRLIVLRKVSKGFPILSDGSLAQKVWCFFIGVSNFNHEQLERLLNKPNLRFKPITNQIECHPYLTQKDLIRFCQSRDVSMTAYRPLGGSSEGVDLLDDPVIQRVAQKYNKSPAQILLRFQIQRNVIVIPKSVTPKRILENIQVFDFELSEQDMNDILGLDRNFRMCRLPIAEHHKDYPFNIDY